MGKEDTNVTTVKNSDGTTTTTKTTTITQKNNDGSTTVTITMNIAQNPPCPGGKAAGGGTGGAAKAKPAGGAKPVKRKVSVSDDGSYAPVGGAPLPGGLTEAEAAKRQKKAPRVKNTTDREFMKDVVNTHNTLRAKHGIPQLQMDEDLNDVAQAYANKLAERTDLEPSSNGFGENTFWSNKIKTGKQVVEAWYAEVSDFNFNKIEPQEDTAHMTQVLWKGSTKLGIAMAKGKDGFYVVANYSPPGNHLGKFPQNIFPLKK